MGYDNECVLNIQSLPGEYFCPVCRTLVYPNEALQSQCTHLYCKPCLAYVVATTLACPYDGYLVTEADSKALIESNKELADTMGKVAVHCLYHRSGCQWQGTLAESTAHCATCNYGNSAVVCNRCGTQIIHRQVQEHAQICPGVQPQGQVMENTQAQAVAAANQAASQNPSSAASAALAATTATATAAATPASAAIIASSVPASTPAAVTAGQAQVQGAAAVYPHAAAQAPTSEQWYQQQQLQYQQYYQQYTGYDQYQQQYQQYAQYQQQVYPQYTQPQMQAAPQQVLPGQQNPQTYMPQPQPQPGQLHAPQPQPQPMPQLQPQPQAQPQQQPHPQPQPQPHVAAVPQMQQQPLAPPQQPNPHAQPHTHPPAHGQPAVQPYPQPQHHAAQARPQQLQGPPLHQQPIPPQQLPQQMPHHQAYPHHQPHPQQPIPHPQQHQQPPMQMPPQPQSHQHTHHQPIPQMQPIQPPAHTVSGYQSYSQPIPGPPQQHQTHMQPQPQGMPPQPQGMPPQQQFPPQQPPQLRTPHPQMPTSVQQQPTMPPPQGPHANLHPAPQQGQHPDHHPGQQQVYQQSGMQPHGQHGFPHPTPHVPSQSVQPPQQGPVPLQHQVHPQQSFRPHASTYVQQPSHGHPHQQGLPAHQSQARPIMVNQGMPHQSISESPRAGSKPMQPVTSQQSPNENYAGMSNPHGSTYSELQSRSSQQSQPPHSVSQGGLIPASPAAPKQEVSPPDKTNQLQTSEGTLTVKNEEGTKSGEKISDQVGYSKSNGNDEAAEVKLKDGEAEHDNKDVPKTFEENVDGPLAKQVKAEEDTNKSGEVMMNIASVEKENHRSDVKPDERSGALFKGEGSHPVSESHTQPGAGRYVQPEPMRPNLDRTNQGFVSDGRIAGAAANNMHSQQMQAPGALDRGHLQQHSAHQHVFPAQACGFSQPAYNDRNPSQYPQQFPFSDDRQGIPPSAPQQSHYGHQPHMQDPSIISQRPPAPDRMFPQPMHQSSQERRFPEPSSHHGHGQTMPPSQIRPPGHNAHEPFPHHGQMPAVQEPFWPPPHSGGGAPSHHGFPPKGFEQQGMAPPGQAPSHLTPGARTALGEPLARPTVGMPPPVPLGTPNRMGAHPFTHEDRMGKPPGINAMEVDVHRRPGFYDGRQPEPHRPVPTEHAPHGEPNVMKMNGMSNNMPAGGMHDSAFARGLPEDRFRPLPDDRLKHFPEGGFKATHDEPFRTSALDPSRHTVNRREFEEDLKQFPRPGQLDVEGHRRFDGYLSSSRPIDRMPLQSGDINAMNSRPLSGAPFPPGVGGPDVNIAFGDGNKPIALHEHVGRRTFPHPDHANLVSEFGRHRVDGLPPLRSPGHFSRDIPDGKSNQLRGLDGGLGPLGHSAPSNPRGGEIGGPQSMPNFFRGGGFSGFRSHIDINESGGPGNLPPHLRIADPGFNGRFPLGSRESDIGSFEQSRKRNAGGMVRCLICKVDCETVEGLELHSQGREHQKMAMDMVLNIKKENAKKHRPSENVTAFEDGNKSRKANFEKHANRN